MSGSLRTSFVLNAKHVKMIAMDARTLIMVSFGNILEWFDFALFIYLAPVMGKNFFFSDNPIFATLMTFGVFAAGFICRPLGGILFGHLGDRIGRAKSLTFSILAISCSTGLMGLLPTYTQIGWLAPGLFITLRLIHGVSVGGEYTGAVIYLGESAPVKKRGFLASFAIAGANLGFFFATLTVLLLDTFFSQTGIAEWGWRICFIGSGCLGLLILYNRLKLQETPAFLQLQKVQQVEEKPLLAALRYPRKLLQIFGLTCMGAPFYYMFFGYMPNYLAQYFGISLLKSLSVQGLLLLAMLIFLPLAGACGDRFGRKKILLFCAIGMILLTIPCFYLMQQNTLMTIFLGLFIATILSALEQSNNLITFVESCPANIRYTGISFAYNVGNAVFGGTAPLIFSVLTEKINLLASAYYLIIMAAIGLMVIMTLAGSPFRGLTAKSRNLASSGSSGSGQAVE